MAKTNKELAVELYSAFLISAATMRSNPSFQGRAIIPSADDMVKQVEILTAKLSTIQDN